MCEISQVGWDVRKEEDRGSRDQEARGWRGARGPGAAAVQRVSRLEQDRGLQEKVTTEREIKKAFLDHLQLDLRRFYSSVGESEEN